MSVYKEILEKLKKEKIHMTLIDPATQSPEKSAEIAEGASKAGTDFIMIGGSSNITSEIIRNTVSRIKKVTDVRVIIFPGSPEMICDNADALYFMSLLNSRNPDFIVGYQASVARKIKGMGIETIPMGYVVFEPGMTVGKVGDASLVGRNDVSKAEAYAIAAELFGMKLVYFESGSGSPTYLDPELVREVRKHLEIPLIVGGGIRTPGAAVEIAKAGADIVVTGTVAERSVNIEETLKPIVGAIKKS